jgi:hypothetical protein
MAVTLATYDLTQPSGELSESLFPGGDFDLFVGGWLGQAKTLVDANAAIATANQNLAAAAWVYHRAYSHVAQRLASSPVSVSTSIDGSISKTMSSDQRKYFFDLAAAKLALYQSYETEAESSTAVIPAFFGRVRASTSSATGQVIY